jgi:hypothetical protein
MADGGVANGEMVGGGRRQGPFRCGDAVACPDCGASNWHVGRRSAECASCGAALPLADGEPVGAAGARLRKGQKGSFRSTRNA